MVRNNRLLSIGEISKLTGVGIKSLRYYEKIGVLKPAHVSPDSGYRYYSFYQTYLIELIRFAIEMDIPLKEFDKFVDENEVMDFMAFAIHAKEVAEKKMKALNKGLGLINYFQKQIAAQEKYPMGEIYTRNLPKRYFHLTPYDGTFHAVDQFEVTKTLADSPFLNEIHEDNAWLDYGFLIKHTPKTTIRYIFTEIPKDKANKNCMTIPKSICHCLQSASPQIENAAEIFGDYLAGCDSWLAIEMEVFSGKVSVHEHINELGVIKL